MITENSTYRVARCFSLKTLCSEPYLQDLEQGVHYNINQKALLIFLHLKEKRFSTLPSNILKDFPLIELRKLIYDGFIEVKSKNRFYTGAKILTDKEIKQIQKLYLTDPVSTEALKYACSSGVQDVGLLTNKLYFYNKRSLTITNGAYFKTPDDIYSYMDFTKKNMSYQKFTGVWSEIKTNKNWIIWYNNAVSVDKTNVNMHKIYIGLRFEDLPNKLPEIFRILENSQTHQAKIGKTVHGLLRSDNFVLHFLSREDLEETALKLKVCCKGISGIRVPFTSSFQNSEIISLGVDPDPTQFDNERISWRYFISQRLAFYISRFNAQPHDTLKAWEFALYRLIWQQFNGQSFMRHSDFAQTPPATYNY